MKQFNNLTKESKGLTLIEMLVAVTIFATVVGAISGLFISGIRSQGRVLATQEILDQTSYVMEYMSRALRMAKKDLNGDCISAKLNYEKTGSGTGGIKFESYSGPCQEFFREWDAMEGVHRLKEAKAGIENYLTSPDLDVVSFNIGPDASWDQNDNDQPRVTISLEMESGRPVTTGPPPRIQIQTSISQRNLDVQY
ncbi:prepilin-type N-terminal cleavage/methylation domain-containing protein [Patescibacteria group bacterium]|nr:prepilin-type N-terminal cleavage/methylation domain-containing protein [Patescibacteria group bacterium]